MRFFIQEQSNPTLEKTGDEDIIKVGETNSYMEIEVKNKEGEYIVCYLVPRSENTYFVVACLDHHLDFILEQVENEDEDKLHAEAKAWPLFVTLLKNGMKGRYSEGVLTQLEDPDCAEKKWFIATVIGNLDFEKQSDLAFEKVSHAMELVLDKTIQMLTEMIEKHPNYGWETAKTFTKAVLTGIGEYANTVVASLNAADQPELAQVLTTLTQAVLASHDLPADQKEEQVKVITQIGKEAAEPKPNKTLLKILVDETSPLMLYRSGQ